MAETLSKQERDKRDTIVWNLEHFVALGVLTIQGIASRITKGRARGLNRLVTLNMGVGGDRNLRDLLEFRPDKTLDVAAAIYQFLLQDDREKFIKEQLLPRITDEDFAKMLAGWMSDEVEVGHRLTYDQMVNSFDVDELLASVFHGLTMVGILETHNMPCSVAPRDLQSAAEAGAEPADTSGAPEVLEEDIDEDEIAEHTGTTPTTGPTDRPDGQ